MHSLARPVATLVRLTCTTPDYIARFGKPTDIASLSSHRVVGLRSITTGNITPLEFVTAEGAQSVSLPSTLSVTGTESYLAGIRLGLGLAQVPRFHVENDLKDGTLVVLLEDLPPPSAPVSLLYLLYTRSRQLAPRVSVFLDWAAREFASHGVAPH
jgi:DNA-binding transcriptional LysR family regulator